MNKLVTALPAILLSGCLIESGNDPDNTTLQLEAEYSDFNPSLVLATASPDYSTSDIAIIGDSNRQQNAVIEQKFATTNPSDVQIAVHNGVLYRLGRYGFDNVTRVNMAFSLNALIVDWQYSVLGDDISANPFDFEVVSNSKAYVSRYDASTLWQVNPSAGSDSDFRQDSIDLSAFANASTGNPFMSDMILIDDRLFVLLVGLDENYGASANSSVVVIDVTDNSIVDTDASQAGVQAIELPVRNAGEFFRSGDSLYISASGDAYNFNDTSNKYSGGVVKLAADSYSVSLVVDDGDSNDAPYGNITNAVVSDAGDLFFSGSAGWGNDSLWVLSNGAATATKVSLGSGTYNIADLALHEGTVYAAVFAQADASESAGLKMIDALSATLTGLIETTYNPTQIVPVN